MRLTGVPRQTARLLRDRSGVQRVTNIELFFDLVYGHGHPRARAGRVRAGVVAAVAAADRLPGAHPPA